MSLRAVQRLVAEEARALFEESNGAAKREADGENGRGGREGRSTEGDSRSYRNGNSSGGGSNGSSNSSDSGPVLQLFEPMGKPAGRDGKRGVSRRSLPEGVLEWLDAVSPLNELNAPASSRAEGGSSSGGGNGSRSSNGGSNGSINGSSSNNSAGGGAGGAGATAKAKQPPTTQRQRQRQQPRHVSWKVCSSSVLTTAKQTNSFDCGVASLLYAECCARGWTAAEMARDIGQREITHYRALLERYIRAIAGVGSAHAKRVTEREATRRAAAAATAASAAGSGSGGGDVVGGGTAVLPNVE